MLAERKLQVGRLIPFGRELEADLGTVRDLLQLHTPVERTLGEAAGAAMDVAPGATGSPQQICDRLRALGFRASKIGRSRRTADVLRSPRHSFVIVESALPCLCQQVNGTRRHRVPCAYVCVSCVLTCCVGVFGLRRM